MGDHTGGAGNFRRNVKWQMLGSASQAVLSGSLLLIVGAQLKAGGFGVFSIVMGFVYVANLLLEPRIQDVAARQFWDFDQSAEARRHHSQYFIDLFLLEAVGKLLPCIALIALASVLARAGNLPAGSALLIVIAAVGTYLSKLGYGLCVGLLRVMGRSDLLAYCATGELLLRLLLTLGWIWFAGLSVMASIVILCVCAIVAGAVQWMLVSRLFGGIGSAVREWEPQTALRRLRENRRLLLANLGLSASDLMNKDLDITLISPLMAPEQVGIYKMAKNLTLLTWRAIDPFYLALMPELSRLVATRDFAGASRLLAKSSLGLGALAMALSLASFSLVVWFGDSVLGPGYGSAPNLMAWMLIGIVASAPLVWGHPLSVALNRADLAFVGSLFASAIGLLAFLALTPVYGTRGAGMAWTLTFLVGFVFTATVSWRLLRQHARAADVAVR
jgi:O-antigen/teichoic acid export membrane protein